MKVTALEVQQALAQDMRLEQIKKDLALGFLQAFPVWVIEHWDFRQEEEP